MSAIANDRFLIAIGTKIEPRIYRTQAEAEKAAETLAFRSGRQVGVYRLSDAGLVAMWRQHRQQSAFRLVQIPPDLAFRADGIPWIDKPASAPPEVPIEAENPADSSGDEAAKP